MGMTGVEDEYALPRPAVVSRVLLFGARTGCGLLASEIPSGVIVPRFQVNSG